MLTRHCARNAVEVGGSAAGREGCVAIVRSRKARVVLSLTSKVNTAGVSVGSRNEGSSSSSQLRERFIRSVQLIVKL